MTAPEAPRHGLDARALRILRDVLEPFAAGIDRVCLFGSRAAGTARENSDIDLVIHGPIGDQQIDRIWTLFDESGLPVPVDVVSYEAIDHRPLREHIDAAEVTLFTRAELEAVGGRQ